MTKVKVSWKKRVFSWGLALAALTFVVWSVPIRDRCEDPTARSGSTRVIVSRASGGDCLLHIKSGDVRISAAECASLKCEPGLASTISHARLDILAVLCAIYFTGTVAWSVRWRMLLSLAGVRLSLFEVWRITMRAQAGGILLPGGIGGDALRVASIVGKGAKASIVIGSVLLDRFLGLVTIASIAAGLGLGLGGAQVGIAAYILAALPFGFVFGILLLRSRWVAGIRSRLDEAAPGLRGRAARALKPILAYVADPKAPRAILLGFLVSLFVSTVQFMVIRGLVSALGATPSQEKWVYVGSAMAMIVAAVPALPGGWGTADAAYVFFLGLAGLTPGVALAVCLLFRLFWYLSGVLGAILHLTSPASASAAPLESLPVEQRSPDTVPSKIRSETK